MTAAEVYDLTTQGGASDFAKVVAVCEAAGPYCLIGGLAVNCYVEPVYTLDADLVMAGPALSEAAMEFEALGCRVETHVHSVNVTPVGSTLRVQFTTDPRYRDFPARAVIAEVLGVPVKVARLEDVVQGKLWAYGDLNRRFSKRKKDELDLIRLAEAYPRLLEHYPSELREQIERG